MKFFCASFGVASILLLQAFEQVSDRDEAVLEEAHETPQVSEDLLEEQAKDSLISVPGFAEKKMDSPRLICSHSVLQGIVLVGDTKDLFKDQELKEKRGLDITKLSFPGEGEELQKELSPFLNSEVEPCGLSWDPNIVSEIKEAIYRYYQKQGYPFVLVTVPPYDSQTRVLQLIVKESTLGKVEVQGNQWTPSARFTNYLSIKPGEPIARNRLLRDLDFMNRNPFRHVNVIYGPGVEPYTTNLILQVQDRKPYRIYVGANNTGVVSTGRQRAYVGFSWDQMFNLDQTLFFQYATGYQGDEFHANTFQYTAYLPIKHELDIYGGYSLVRANIAFPNRKNKGKNAQGSIRYHIPFYVGQYSSHQMTAGFDLKNTNNTMEFVEFFATVGHTVNMSQWSVAYKGKYDTGNRRLEGGVELVISPFEWLPNQSKADFESLRPDADSEWVYTRAFLDIQQILPRHFLVLGRFVGQATPQILLPSEQLGIGGYGTVRGYDERQYNADCGVIINGELHTPGFPVFARKKSHPDEVHFLFFLDVGWGVDITKMTGFKKHDLLAGAGPGIRYSWAPYLSARLDWGFKLHQQAGFSGGLSMVHFNITASY